MPEQQAVIHVEGTYVLDIPVSKETTLEQVNKLAQEKVSAIFQTPVARTTADLAFSVGRVQIKEG